MKKSQDANAGPATLDESGATEEPLEREPLDPGRVTLRQRIRDSWPARLGVAILLVALLAAAVVPGYLYYQRPHPTLAAARFGTITLTVRARGVVQATVYSASFSVSGTVTEIDVVPGQQVEAGATLAALDTTAARTALTDAQTEDSDAESALLTTQTEFNDAEAALAAAEKALGSAQSANDTICGAVSPNTNECAAAEAALDAAQARVAAAQTRVDAAESREAMAQVALDRAQGALDAAQTALATTTLVAPHAGIVLLVSGQVGDEIGAAGTPFITIADTANPLATVMVRYRDILAVDPGEMATLAVKQASGATALRGQVYGYTLIPQGTGDGATFPVTIAIDPASLKGARLLPGMDASATITTRQRANVVTVPERAVVYTRQAAPPSGKGLLKASQIKDALQAASDLESLVVATGLDTAHDQPLATYLVGLDHGKFVAIPVVLGLSDGHSREVITGLQAGQQVVTGEFNPFAGR